MLTKEKTLKILYGYLIHYDQMGSKHHKTNERLSDYADNMWWVTCKLRREIIKNDKFDWAKSINHLHNRYKALVARDEENHNESLKEWHYGLLKCTDILKKRLMTEERKTS